MNEQMLAQPLVENEEEKKTVKTRPNEIAAKIERLPVSSWICCNTISALAIEFFEN